MKFLALPMILLTLVACEDQPKENSETNKKPSSNTQPSPELEEKKSDGPSGELPAAENEQNPTTPKPSASEGTTNGNSESPSPESTPSSSSGVAPTAVAVPGRPGYCFNPFTNNIVDVRGIPPGSLVKDPMDPNPEHVFRAP